mgnify:FL=1
MLTSDLLATAYKGIAVNRTRSLLTMLGIIIGVGSVVLMVSLGKSFQAYIVSQIDTIGTNTIDVFPVGLERFGGNLDALTYDDYESVSKLSSVQSVTPIIIVSKPVKYEKEEVSPMVMGAHREIFANYSLTIDRGRILDRSDEDGAKAVAVLSYQTALDLFGNLEPLGKKVTIGSSSFTVVGVLKGIGSLLLQDLDKPVYIPFSTARSLTGQKHLSFMSMKSTVDPQLAIQDIKSLLRERHGIDNEEDDPDKDDFNARSAEQVTGIVNSVTLGLTIFLALVAGISLLVGGIGIMNIMLVSVTERTREIGLRKAIGARSKDILLQFLLEAVSLTLTGGLIGIIGGVSVGWIFSLIAARFLGTFSFILSSSAILLAVGMALSVGLIFGLYPAKRAAALSPMEALRYE